MWHVGDNDGGAGFSDVPVYPQDALWMCKAIISVKNSGKDLLSVSTLLLTGMSLRTYDKDTQTKYAANCCFSNKKAGLDLFSDI